VTLEVIDPASYGGLIATVLFVGILVSLSAGRWLGQRDLARHGSVASPSVGSLEAAVFALLGLLIAFTFSGGLTRFDLRRAQAVQEANAIGTAYLRIDLLPASAQPALREGFRAYADARIATYQALPDVQAAQKELDRSRQLQGAIWARTVAALELPGVRPATVTVVAPAVNEMFDMMAVRIAATQIHPPLIVYAMLIVLAIASALLAGYQSAGEKAYDWIHKIGFAAIVAFTVYIVLDMEYPRLGFIRIDAIDRLLIDARASMK
jgi:hypothetical protein